MRRSSYLERVARAPLSGVPVLRPPRGLQPRWEPTPVDETARTPQPRVERTQTAQPPAEKSAPVSQQHREPRIWGDPRASAPEAHAPAAATPAPTFVTRADEGSTSPNMPPSAAPGELESTSVEARPADAAPPVSPAVHSEERRSVPTSETSSVVAPMTNPAPPAERTAPKPRVQAAPPARAREKVRERTVEPGLAAPREAAEVRAAIESARASTPERLSDSPFFRPPPGVAAAVRIGSIEVVITPPPPPTAAPQPPHVPSPALQPAAGSTGGRVWTPRLARGFVSAYGFRQE